MVEQHISNGSGMLQVKTGLGVAMSFVLSSQIFPFMLSSAFTARNIVQEKDDVDGVQTDMWWALGASIISSGIIGVYLGNDLTVFMVGSAFALALFLIYSYRGNIPVLG